MRHGWRAASCASSPQDHDRHQIFFAPDSADPGPEGRDLAQRLARVDARVNDVSDATRDVLAAQMEKETGEIAWRRVDATRKVDDIAAELAESLPL